MLEKTIEKSIPTLRRLAEPLAQWHAENRLKMDLARIGSSELDRVLADAGLTRRDLPSGLGDRRGSRTLMARMLSRFGVRPDRIAVRYQGALRDAERAKTDRARKGHRETAIKAMRAYDMLSLETGIMPKEATKIYQVTQTLRPMSGRQSEIERSLRSDDEVRADIIKLLGEPSTV